MKNLTREELIEVGRKIVEVSGSQDEINELVELFNKNVPHPNGANLFYYPENYNSRTFDVSKYNPKIEEIVDHCLKYKPFEL